MNWLGDYPEDFTTVCVYFTTHDSNGAPVAPLTAYEANDVKIYKNGNAAEKTTTNGVTMTSPFDSIVGLHCVVIDTSNDTGDSGFWTTGGGSVYSVVLNPDTETVNGQVTVKVLGTFGIALSPALRPTTAGRTLDVSAGGGAGVDWANVKSPTTALALTGTTIATTQKVDVDTIKTNPVANGGTVTFPSNATLASTTNITAGTIATVSGNVNGNVGGSVASVTGLTASDVGAIKTKTDFLPSATAGASGGVFIAGTNAATTITTSLTTTFTGNLTGSVSSVAGAVGSVSGNVGGNVSGSVASIASGGIAASSFASGAINAAAIATDAIGAAELADDAATEIATAVWAAATRLLTAGTNIVLAKGTGVTGFNDLDAAGVRSAVGLASANLDTQLGTIDTDVLSRLASASYTAPNNSGISSIKTQTDKLTFTVTNQVDANIKSVKQTTVSGSGTSGDPWGP